MRKSYMNHRFSEVPRAEIQRSRFDRSHGYKTTFDAGYLIPVYVDEMLPGDSFKLNMSFLARLATPIVPIMDNIYLTSFFFFVPNRLIWKNWERFMGDQPYPGASTDFLVPQQTAPADGWPVGSFEDYVGLPTGVGNVKADELVTRAYALIWNEWFRDENLQNPVNLSTWQEISAPGDLDDIGVGDSGSNVAHTLLKRGKRHDYFTSALPWPQKGPGVELPLGGSASINGEAFINSLGVTGGTWSSDSGVPSTNISAGFTSQEVTSSPTDVNVPFSVSYGRGSISGDLRYGTVDTSGLTADLSSATAVTINSLREAFQLQKLYERDARGGTRYTEIIRSHFGVVSPDARLQRPEYLGGRTTAIMVRPVEQQSASDGTTPQGNLAAYAFGADSRHGFTYSAVEHGIVIGLICAWADLTYQQGMPRMFSRQTRFDYYWPVLAHLGEQVIKNKEIYTQGNAQDDDPFGYQERYGEYRYFPSQITGKFRSTFAQPLDYWHLSQKFDSLPVLNSEFIEENPPIDRVIAVPSEPQFIFDSYFDLKCARPMPVYSVPGLVDHF